MEKWKEKVVYQIWPRSFCDSNGDGIGDLQGIVSRLDYLQSLGVDLIWLSPIYASGNKDYGYDVSDYYKIHPEFGTMNDFDELLSEAKKRGLGIIMDLVANHTSDEHQWFRSALEDEDSPYRDYYFFRKGEDERPPNDWMSFFGGSAWTYDSKSGDYYLTQFTPHQCDLNWENQQMRYEIYNAMRFWLDKGVAGFRMDVINAISKAEGLPSVNLDKKGLKFPGELTLNRSKSHEYLQEMHREVLSKYDCIAIGEGVLAQQKDVAEYTNPKNKELQMMFQFELHGLGYGSLGKYDFRKLYRWHIREFKQVIYSWQVTMEARGGWLGNYLSNHDQNRHISRFGDDGKYRQACAKAFCLLNLTLKGTPFIYQGEEIGMTDCKLEEAEWRDYEALNAFEVLQSMMHVPRPMAKRIVKKVTRDNSRTPMQWDNSLGGGFTTGKPWIKMNPNYTEINVAQEEGDEDSILDFYRQTIAWRKKHRVLTWGSFEPLLETHKQVIGYRRKGEGESLVILINLTARKVTLHKGDLEGLALGEIVYGTHALSGVTGKNIELKPYEGRIYR